MTKKTAPIINGYELPLYVYHIYDTSFFMLSTQEYNDRVFGEIYISLIPDTLIRLLNEEFWIDRDVVPKQVQFEVEKHFHSGDKEKKRLAKLAKERIADYTGSGAEEPDLKELIVKSSGSRVSAESTVDRLLINYAKRLAGQSKSNFVYVLTDDGGIKLDICRINREENIKIYCGANKQVFEKDFISIFYKYDYFTETVDFIEKLERKALKV